MNTLQRYRHIPVLPPAVGVGQEKFRTIDRSALIKKAMTAVIPPNHLTEDVSYQTAVFLSDLMAFAQQCALDWNDLHYRAKSIRADHSYRGEDQQRDLDQSSGE